MSVLRPSEWHCSSSLFCLISQQHGEQYTEYLKEKGGKSHTKKIPHSDKKLISQDEFDRDVMKFVVNKMLPISMTEDEFFRTFVLSEWHFHLF